MILEILKIENRIARMSTRGKDNANIIRKLQRRLYKLRKGDKITYYEVSDFYHG